MEKSTVAAAQKALASVAPKPREPEQKGVMENVMGAVQYVGKKAAKAKDVAGSAVGGVFDRAAALIGVRSISPELQKKVAQVKDALGPYMGASKDKLHLVSVWGEPGQSIVVVSQTSRQEVFTVEVKKGAETEKTYSLSVDDKGHVTLKESAWIFKETKTFSSIEEAIKELGKYGTPVGKAAEAAAARKAGAAGTIAKFEELFHPQVVSASHATSELARLEIPTNQVAFWPTKTETEYYYLSVNYKGKTKTYEVDFTKKGEVSVVVGDRRIKIDLGKSADEIVKNIIVQDMGGVASEVLNPEKIKEHLQTQGDQQWATGVRAALGSSSSSYFLKKPDFEEIAAIAKDSGRSIGVLYLDGKNIMLRKQVLGIASAPSMVVIDPKTRKISLEGEAQSYDSPAAFIRAQFSEAIPFKQAVEVANQKELTVREQMLAQGMDEAEALRKGRAAMPSMPPAASVVREGPKEEVKKKEASPQQPTQPAVVVGPPVLQEVVEAVKEASTPPAVPAQIIPTMPNEEIRAEFNDLIGNPEEDIGGWLSEAIASSRITDEQLVWLVWSYLAYSSNETNFKGKDGGQARAVEAFIGAIAGRPNASSLAKCLMEHQVKKKKANLTRTQKDNLSRV
jgi:hypothetical protein